ncbi:MAG: ferredoxin [Candidatus Binatia bacterium]|nr:MAG: ferredoxin [Candidatus Binatia bacterium]
MAESLGLRIQEEKFWDRQDLRAEIDRVFDICHGCRLCFKFCGSFPLMFEEIDAVTERRRKEYLEAHPEIVEAAEKKREEAARQGPREHDGERAEGFGDELPELQGHARDLTDEQIDRVVDLCFQCKLCYPNCPYTPPHEYAVDFPRLLLRWKAVRARERGIPLRSRLVRNTKLLGTLGSLAPGLARRSLSNPVVRLAMEKTLGIHRKKDLPRFHGETFERWWKRRGGSRPEEPAPLREGIETPTPLRVVFFATCLVNYHDPACGRAAVRVLEHNGVEVVYPPGQVCCGMPVIEGGDLERAADYGRHNLEALSEWVERGYEVVVPSPSCSLVLREEYPQLLGGEKADRIAGHTHDLCLYLYRIAREGRLKRDFRRKLDKIPYHVPCHLRAQNVGFRARDLLGLVAEEVVAIQECSGHDGTWSMQVEHFEDSLHWGRKLFDELRAAAGEKCTAACTDCALAGTQIRQATGLEPLHPVVVLAWAYGFEVGDVGKVLDSLAEAAARGEKPAS